MADQNLDFSYKVEKLVFDNIDYYELEFITQKFKRTDPIWWSKIIKIN